MFQEYFYNPRGFKMNKRQFYVYIMTNKCNTVLYTGVTNDLLRIYEHKNKLVEDFTKKYNITKLVYCDITEDIESAIRREKQLKNWHRDWKAKQITRFNSQWRDLTEDFK